MAPADFLLAIDFGGSKTALATADATGTLLADEVLPVRAAQEATETLGAALQAARRLIGATSGRAGGRCVAVGVSTPGIPSEAGVELSPNLSGWESVSLASELCHGLGVAHVLVANDVKCAARCELRWGALRGADPGIYVNLGTGVATAVAVGGHVLHGAHGGAGEIGYARFWAPEHPTKTALEDLVGGRGLARLASEIAGVPTTVAEVFAAPAGTALHALIETALEGLAAQLRSAALLLDPERIVVGGGLMSDGERILESLRTGLDLPAPLRAEVVPARYLNDAPLRGAVDVLLENRNVADALVGRGES